MVADAREEELKYFMREGMRIAQAMNALSHEVMVLVRGDQAASVEVMVGYCKVLFEECPTQDTPENVARTILCQFSPPSVDNSEWVEQIIDRLKQEMHFT